jgi:hypothetical protein
MALGSHSGSPKIFLQVSFGKIRQKSLENKQKVDASTPGAVRRETQSGSESWALEHDFLSGIIENIFYKEDAQYGNSFEVVISDVVDQYQLSFTEDSRYWFDFMKKLPNVDLKSVVKISAYDFVNKENKRVAGCGVEQNNQKVASYYEVKDKDGKWTLLHGFPVSDGVVFKDKDEIKMYFIKVKKFLRNQFNDLIQPKLEGKENKSYPISDTVKGFVQPNNVDDINSEFNDATVNNKLPWE